MKAYIKQTTETSLFEQARVGLIQMGWETMHYNTRLPYLEDGDICIGYISDIHQILLRHGKKVPQSIDYPIELSEHFGRKIKTVKNLQEISIENYPYFIKPTNHKQFKGTCVREFKDLIGIPDNIPLYYTKELLDITSEYRAYIIENELAGIKHYKGDPYITPNKETVDEMIGKYKGGTYSLDVGVTKEGRTICIEVNSGYSSGNYGLSELMYAKFLMCGFTQVWNEG